MKNRKGSRDSHVRPPFALDGRVGGRLSKENRRRRSAKILEKKQKSILKIFNGSWNATDRWNEGSNANDKIILFKGKPAKEQLMLRTTPAPKAGPSHEERNHQSGVVTFSSNFAQEEAGMRNDN